MRLFEIMSTSITKVNPGETASVAWSRMQSRGIRHLLVMEKDRLVGVISDRDLGGRNGATIRKGRIVAELMTKKVAKTTSKMTLRQAVNLMRGRSIGCLPVVDHGSVVGIVTATDVLRALGRESRQGKKITKSVVNLSSKKNRLTDKTEKTAKSSRQIANPIDRIYIRSHGLVLGLKDRAYLRRKIGLKLGKFVSAIERVSIRIEDINGPRGGTDKVCRIKVVLRGLPSIIVESRSATLQLAMDDVVGQAEKTVKRTVGRRRTMGRRTKATSEALHRIEGDVMFESDPERDFE